MEANGTRATRQKTRSTQDQISKNSLNTHTHLIISIIFKTRTLSNKIICKNKKKNISNYLTEKSKETTKKNRSTSG